MSPEIGGVLPREVLKGGMAIDGIPFPPGTDLGVHYYTLYHNQAYYSRSFDYMLERWIVKDGLSGKIEWDSL